MEEKARAAPYPLRMPDELRTQLEAAASAGNRSLHSEILARLQQTFDPQSAEDDEWDLRVEERLLELQHHAIEEDLRVQRIYKDALWARVRALEASDPNGQLERAVRIAVGVDDDLTHLVERLHELQAKRSTLEAKLTANSRKRNEGIDRVVTPQIEAEFQASHARQSRLWEEFKALGGTKQEIAAAKAAEQERLEKTVELRELRLSGVRYSGLGNGGGDLRPALEALMRGEPASSVSSPPPLAPKVLAHYQAIRQGQEPQTFEPGPPAVEKHAPRPSPNARKSLPKKR